MTDTGHRRFEVATEGSDFSEALCHGVLEVKADQLATEAFIGSAMDLVQEERRWSFGDDTYVTASFLAQKYTMDEDGVFEIMYNPYLTFTRPRTALELWPEMKFVGVDEDGRDIGEVLSQDEIELDQDEVMARCYAQDVWDYYLDNKRYAPRKNLRREYYFINQMVGIIQLESTEDDEVFSEDVEENIDLQLKDRSFHTSFSELDVELIEAICALDFPKIRNTLDRLGAWERMP